MYSGQSRSHIGRKYDDVVLNSPYLYSLKPLQVLKHGSQPSDDALELLSASLDVTKLDAVSQLGGKGVADFRFALLSGLWNDDYKVRTIEVCCIDRFGLPSAQAMGDIRRLPRKAQATRGLTDADPFLSRERFCSRVAFVDERCVERPRL